MTYLKIGRAAVILIALAITTGSAVAQSRVLARVEIPFSFSALDHTFSSGSYEIQQVGAQAILLRDASSNNGVILATPQTIGESTTTKIVFRDYGSQKFLAAVIASSYEIRIAASRRETEVANAVNSPARELALR